MPCYNEQEILRSTLSVMSELLKKLVGEGLISEKSHLLFIDDGSTDGTWDIICEHKDTAWVKALKLAGNVGHQKALFAGLSNCDADVTVSIDADLQDDPEVIREMLVQYNKGFDIVFGVRNDRTNDSFLKRFTAESFYKLMNLFNIKLVFNHADFRLLSKKVVDNLKQYNEYHIFLRGVINNIGYRKTTVEYKRESRKFGVSKYTPIKMLTLAMDGLFSFSVLPLRWILVGGLFLSVLCFTVALWVVYTVVFTDKAVPGWASTMLPILFIGGIQIFALGVIGEYLGKLYQQSKNRPLYWIEDSF